MESVTVPEVTVPVVSKPLLEVGAVLCAEVCDMDFTNIKVRVYIDGVPYIFTVDAFAIKDISCGTSHTVTQFLLGNSNKNDVDACVDAISAIACEKWNVPNPTPRECFGVSTKNK